MLEIATIREMAEGERRRPGGERDEGGGRTPGNWLNRVQVSRGQEVGGMNCSTLLPYPLGSPSHLGGSMADVLISSVGVKANTSRLKLELG